MTKLARYLKNSAGMLVAIVALLFLQAYCDLTLPEYTSKIVNEGIQQKVSRTAFRTRCVRNCTIR